MRRFLQRNLIYSTTDWKLFTAIDSKQQCAKILIQTVPVEYVQFVKQLQNTETIAPKFQLHEEEVGQLLMLYKFPTLGLLSSQATHPNVKPFTDISLVDYIFQTLDAYQGQCKTKIKYAFHFSTVCFNRLSQFKAGLQPLLGLSVDFDIHQFLQQIICNSEDTAKYLNNRLCYDSLIIGLTEAVTPQTVDTIMMNDIFEELIQEKHRRLDYLNNGLLANQVDIQQLELLLQ
ncbi:hypothetical protein SS50377_26826 [Spironucleus salmonicida]|uniref:Uncharacterized protein n=1 Tax=Spironucleus salmonicida TaxID=348837 RepID=V6LXL9_9EUKA|nr:hypothetical protein SS50377_26826 [Spironucleus salmonicida]|eukprot:EST49295.1 Hypothetical protein SS50377_10518 [Spironucleus salmonicida]